MSYGDVNFLHNKEDKTIRDMPLLGFVFCRCLHHPLTLQLASVTLGPTCSFREPALASSTLVVLQRTPPFSLQKSPPSDSPRAILKLRACPVHLLCYTVHIHVCILHGAISIYCTV